MKTKIIKNSTLLLLLLVTIGCNQTIKEQEEPLPNILIVLADDMGYGDATCYNSDSKIITPAIDQIAATGMRFTNAHAPGTLCTPSRYGLLTGHYPFRNTRNYKEGLIDPDRMTLASLLKAGGYKTAVIGKWHQGMIDEKIPQPAVTLERNPGEYGFDYHFILPASLDIPPYYYVENGMCVNAPTDTVAANNTPGISPIQGKFWRSGGIAPGYKFENVVDELTAKAIQHMAKHFETEEAPMFLYFPLPSPHTPWLPNAKYQGITPIGDYGDYTSQTDGALGALLAELKKQEQLKNTLVIFTSDNGPVWYHEDVKRYGHSSTGPLRGMKGDAWEGGQRMPFVVQWPGKVKPNMVSNHLICFTDLMATFAEITKQELPPHAGEDSYSFLHQLIGSQSKSQRQNLVLKGMSKESYFIIEGDWKYIDIPGPGGFSAGYLREKGVEFNIPKQLYNLSNDLGEKENLFLQHKEKAQELAATLKQILDDQ